MNYNPNCICAECQAYRQIRPMTIPQTWIDGIKNQTQSQAIFQHVDPTDKVSSPAEPVQGGGTVEKKPCCEKCVRVHWITSRPMFCGNAACECHSAQKKCCGGLGVMGKCGRGTKKGCKGLHCRCMGLDCSEMHYVDCFEHYIHVEHAAPTKSAEKQTLLTDAEQSHAIHEGMKDGLADVFPKSAEKKILYNQRDHSHCFEFTNPPCGLKGEHLHCCLCGVAAPTKSAETFKCIEHKGQSGNAYLDCEFCKPTTDTSDNWRERFFDSFAMKGSRDFISSKSLYEIEAFIEKEKQLSFEDGRKGFEHWVEAGRQQERASLRERIAELKHKRPLNEQGAHLYDRALDDLLDTLKDTH